MTKTEGKKWVKASSKNKNKESHDVSVTPPKTSTTVKFQTSAKKSEVLKTNSYQQTRSNFNQQGEKQRLILKEMQGKEYSLSDTEVLQMLEELLAYKLIELPEMKRPEEANRVNDPNYYRYHCLVSHPTQRCFILKEKIIQLASQGKILLEEEKETAATHQTTIVSAEEVQEMRTVQIQFGSCPPVEVVVVVVNQPKPPIE
ncbi:hypothetical protein [Bartonella sp. AC140YNZD]|uniref:hypothetical protein n=1 Tax=Bartonella sp. AC140YNZD TaxID=3243447 RepID=UPI0035CF6C39